MSRLYLITGFLGAGKSTFLKNFIRLFAGQKVQLIINEFGKEGVDDVLLSRLGAEISEISGGSVFCSCKIDQFEYALKHFVKKDTDVVLVEASGLSDTTGVRGMFTNTNRFPEIEFRGTICLIDAVRFPKVYEKSRTCVKQLASSDLAVINKVDLATEEQLVFTRELVRNQRPDITMLETVRGEINEDILNLLSQVSKHDEARMTLSADLTTKKLMVRIAPNISIYSLEKFIKMFLEVTFRVKGFIETIEGLVLVDCTGNVPLIRKYIDPVPKEKIGKLVILSGAKMPVNKRVKEAADWYREYIIDIKTGD